MPGREDGGIWALGGYLYQIIGTLGIGAHVLNLGNEPGPGRDLDVLMELIDVKHSEALEIRPEAYDEDALISTCGFRQDDEGVFVQFKYSAQMHPPSIGPKDVQQIVNAFDQSARRACDCGRKISACVLITNRGFAQGAESGGQEWQKAKEDRQEKYRLEEITGYSEERFEDKLRNFAMSLGAIGDEIEGGISKLIGEVIVQVVGRFVEPRSFGKTLAKAFTGYPDAEPIAVHCLRGKCRRQLDEFAEGIRVDKWDFSPVEREVFRDLFNLVQERALIGLWGHGGCGKSVLLWQLLTSTSCPACGVCEALNARVSWISDLVNHDFRHLPPDGRVDWPDEAIERLSLANPGVRPVLWLGLDGLDEIEHNRSDQQEAARQIVNWFWQQDEQGTQSKAVLIATFRSRAQLDDILGLSYDHPGRRPEVIEVGQFSDRELNQAFQRTSPDLVAIGPQGPFEHSLYAERFSPAQEDYSFLPHGINDSTLVSLHHPVVWRSFLNLAPQVRDAALRGDQTALDQLACGIIKWFAHKLNRKADMGLREEELLQLLSDIARCSSMGPLYSRNDWSHAAEKTYGPLLARRFMDEAKLAGLIEADSRETWHWKHAFVYRFLKRCQG